MRINVKKNARRNIAIAIVSRVPLQILVFLTKSVINIYLGAEYLGLNSLFGSVITVLSLTELGIGSAMVYHMYKPIAKDDTEKICALLNFYKKTYFIIGVITTAIGLALLPFLPHLIKGNCPPTVNIYVLYLTQLSSNCVSYFLFGYKQVLLTAYQREDFYSIIHLLTQGGMQIAQLVLIILTKNYYYYTLCSLFFTVINNLWIGWFTRRLFPHIVCRGKLDQSVLDNMKRLVAGSFIQKVCSVTRNALDSVCLSAFVGLAVTGMYNNYYAIFNVLRTGLSVCIASLTGGVGNHIAIKSKEENFQEMQRLDFLYLLISGWCVCCLLCLTQPFMKLWMGEKMLLSDGFVVCLCVYLYILKVGDVRGLYYSTTGMWWEMRHRSFFETIGNLVLNIALGYFFGVIGIVLATVISLLAFNFFWGATIVFKNYFGMEKLKAYFKYQLTYFLVTVFVCMVTWTVTSKVSSQSDFMTLVFRAGICLVLPTAIYFLIYFRTRIFKESIKML